MHRGTFEKTKRETGGTIECFEHCNKRDFWNADGYSSQLLMAMASFPGRLTQRAPPPPGSQHTHPAPGMQDPDMAQMSHNCTASTAAAEHCSRQATPLGLCTGSVQFSGSGWDSHTSKTIKWSCNMCRFVWIQFSSKPLGLSEIKYLNYGHIFHPELYLVIDRCYPPDPPHVD